MPASRGQAAARDAGRKRERGGEGGKGKGKEADPKRAKGGARPPSDRNAEPGAAVAAYAAEHWPLGSEDQGGAVDESVVRHVWAAWLSKPARGRDASARLGALELSGYLERYLWPRLESGQSHASHLSPLTLSLSPKPKPSLWPRLESGV